MPACGMHTCNAATRAECGNAAAVCCSFFVFVVAIAAVVVTALSWWQIFITNFTHTHKCICVPLSATHFSHFCAIVCDNNQFNPSCGLYLRQRFSFQHFFFALLSFTRSLCARISFNEISLKKSPQKLQTCALVIDMRSQQHLLYAVSITHTNTHIYIPYIQIHRMRWY